MQLVQAQKHCKEFAIGTTAQNTLDTFSHFTGDTIILSKQIRSVDTDAINVTSFEDFEKMKIKEDSTILIDAEMEEWSRIKDQREWDGEYHADEDNYFPSTTSIKSAPHPVFDITQYQTMAKIGIICMMGSGHTEYDSLVKKLKELRSFRIGLFHKDVNRKASCVEHLNKDILPNHDEYVLLKLTWFIGKHFFGYFTPLSDEKEIDF